MGETDAKLGVTINRDLDSIMLSQEHYRECWRNLVILTHFNFTPCNSSTQLRKNNEQSVLLKLLAV